MRVNDRSTHKGKKSKKRKSSLKGGTVREKWEKSRIRGEKKKKEKLTRENAITGEKNITL